MDSGHEFVVVRRGVDEHVGVRGHLLPRRLDGPPLAVLDPRQWQVIRRCCCCELFPLSPSVGFVLWVCGCVVLVSLLWPLCVYSVDDQRSSWQCRGCSYQLRLVASPRLSLDFLPHICYTSARNDDDKVSWYVTGKACAFFFFYLYKESIHGQIKLGKIAGEFSWTKGVRLCSK